MNDTKTVTVDDTREINELIQWYIDNLTKDIDELIAEYKKVKCDYGAEKKNMHCLISNNVTLLKDKVLLKRIEDLKLYDKYVTTNDIDRICKELVVNTTRLNESERLCSVYHSIIDELEEKIKNVREIRDAFGFI